MSKTAPTVAMNEPALPDKVLAIHKALSKAKIAHAFGGALALAYYAEPRATIDIDVNVFVAPAAYATVERALAPLGVDAIDQTVTNAMVRAARGGGARQSTCSSPTTSCMRRCEEQCARCLLERIAYPCSHRSI